MKKFFREFKDFALKGNFVDLAIAVVIGGAFNAIVKSLVDNIIMPLIEILLSGEKISKLYFVIGKAKIQYGAFLQSVVNFLIIAFTIFVVIKIMMVATDKIKRKELEKIELEEEGKAEEIDKKEMLLEEIRDLLKKNADK